MKRRDLIWNLTDKVYNENIHLIEEIAQFYKQNNWSSSHRHLRLLIDRIVQDCEKNGMVPQTKAKLINGKDFPYGGGCSMRCNCGDCNPEFILPEWEPEE